MSEITTPADLRALLGEVAPRPKNKERPALLEVDRQWIANSPFIVLATSDAEGNCDASPKGDPPGFVKILNDKTIAIPERPGNRRADGYLNILANPHVGILFVIPGRADTLRINGRARLLRDAPYFDDMQVKGHRPILAIEIDIDTIFFHCAKAFMRSALWQPQHWPAPETLPSTACLVKAVQPATPETIEQLESHYSAETYEKLLYRS
ncbi:pyridoxamine 5'-phosphate oxidase family protein [Nocardia sp. NBC_00511]|uniref:pyridoxamine 5'-phosphate oxidase family protein n=1 Tax=Nocardia sp. NBC_00511 TaxID=2903591 RepID=UPI0030E2BB7D